MGFIYALANAAMPGILKIGITSQEVELRARSLYTTGVALPFTIAFRLPLDDPFPVEVAVHQALDEYRVNQSREFFAISVEFAIEAICEAACDYHATENARPYDYMNLMNTLADDSGMEPW